MGAMLSSESVFTAAVLVIAVALGYHQYKTNLSDAVGSAGLRPEEQPEKTKRSEEKPGPLAPPVFNTSSFSSTIPGHFHDIPNNSLSSKTKSPKKKKKSTIELNTTLQPLTNSPPTSDRYSQPLQLPTAVSIDTNDSWTHANTRRRAGKKVGQSTVVDITTTINARITPHVTETESSSPSDESTAKCIALAERLAPKAPKTDVDDMLPEQPPLARVIRVHPLPNEKPPHGFTWSDYDNVHIPDSGENGADGEDDGEWDVVENKRARIAKREGQASVLSQRPVAKTKKQRQNANRREAGKAANAAVETDRLARLAKHKHELERIRIMEQSRSSKKGLKSGGMTSVVDDRGKLVWE